MTECYLAVERFGPWDGEGWQKYIEWSGLRHLQEVVSLDASLCRWVLPAYTEEDWKAGVYHAGQLVGFQDPDYLLSRIADRRGCNILGVILEPGRADEIDDPRFEFAGFDLLETGGCISALVNCGGFERAFSPESLSRYGLITRYDEARLVQQRLREQYPDELHAWCDLWGIWRMRPELLATSS